MLLILSIFMWTFEPDTIYVGSVLKWEASIGQDFKIQVSEDAINWATIKSITGNKSFEDYISLQGSGRYVKDAGN